MHVTLPPRYEFGIKEIHIRFVLNTMKQNRPIRAVVKAVCEVLEHPQAARSEYCSWQSEKRQICLTRN